MTKARHGNTASIYRVRQKIGKTHRANCEPATMISPIYRGYRVACLSSEIEAHKRAVGADRYLKANDPAERVQVLMEERNLRDQPREWT